MPPAAISRSSTYFPKICGNIAFSHRSAFSALLLALHPTLLGCGPLEPEVVTLEIRAHPLDASERCRIGEDENPTLTLQALGPFPVSLLGGEVLPLRTSSQSLTFPDDTRGVEAVATDFTRFWHGYSDRRTKSGIDVLLWEDGVGCDLFDGATRQYPGSNAGQAMGYSAEAGVLLVAGGDESESTAAAGSLAFDSGTGKSDLVPPNLSFPEARAFATVTPFGSGLLLAGGEDPLNPDERVARQTAVVYDPALGGFDGDVIDLEIARTHHAAVVLENGETLLVGGGRPSGGTPMPVTLFEAVSPHARRSRIDGLIGLGAGRLEPSAVRLSDGTVLVGGGYDASGAPVSTLEWFSADGSSEVTPGDCESPPCQVLEARYHRSFVALPGGGALTVGGCVPGPQSAECDQACGAGFGCPATEFKATWIAPDGELTDFGLIEPRSCPGVAPGTPFVPERVLLAPGSDGSPWLIAYDESVGPSCRAVFRFDPWAEDGPTFAPATLELSDWPDPDVGLTSLGPDAFVWLTADDPPLLAGTRAGIRGALSQNETLLTTDPSAPLVPEHLAPDRAPHADGHPQAIFRARDSGRLILDRPTEFPAVTVTITDALYDDVTVVFDFSGNGPPLVLLGAYEVGGAGCPWPAGAVPPLTVIRRGSEVTLSDNEQKTASSCRTSTGPVSIAFRAGSTDTTVTSLSVTRN